MNEGDLPASDVDNLYVQKGFMGYTGRCGICGYKTISIQRAFHAWYMIRQHKCSNLEV